jgi:hypothetical protein
MLIKIRRLNLKNTRKITILILSILVFTFSGLNVVNSQEVKPLDQVNQSNVISQENQKPTLRQPEIKSDSISSNINLNVFGKGVVQFAVVFTFIFYLVCITINYGYRTYWNSPLHPSFMPFVYVAVAAILAFTVVLSFDIAVGGTIDFEFLGQKFRGASGPIILWILAFLTIMVGFRLSGATELAKSDIKPNPPSHHLLNESSSITEEKILKKKDEEQKNP